MSNKTRKQIFIFGYYGAGNLGDELILKTILNFLPADYEAVVAGRDPAQIEKDHGVRAVKFSALNFPRVIRQIKNSDRVIIGGGDLFQELTSRRSLKAVYAVYRAAKFFKKSVCFLGISAGPIFSEWGKQAVKKMVSGADLVISRSRETHEFFKTLAGDKENFIKGVDLAFWAAPPEVAPEKFHRDFPEQLIIGVSLRNWFSERREDKLKIIAELLNFAVEKHRIKIVFLPFQFEKDKIIENQFLKFIKNRQAVIAFSQPLSVEKMWAAVKGTSGIVGMRFHSLVMGVILDKPVFSLGYAPKNRELMKALGLEFFNLPMEKIDLEKSGLVFNDFLNRLEEIKAIVGQNRQFFYELVEKTRKKLDSFLAGVNNA